MLKTTNEIKRLIEEIALDLPAVSKVKAAAARVRKNSLTLEKTFKEFRKVSVAHHKK